MDKECAVVFPMQLFEDHPALEKGRVVFLVEEFLLFRFQAFHRIRLVFLRAAMKAYEQRLKKEGYTVKYLDAERCRSRGAFLKEIKREGYLILHVVDPVDAFLEEDLEKDGGFDIYWYDSPQFYLTREEVEAHFEGKKVWRMSEFYSSQRKKFDVMMRGGKPIGGKWSYDSANRKPLPKGFALEGWPKITAGREWKEAVRYVDTLFTNSYGEVREQLYPVTIEGAKRWLLEFFKRRFSQFGPYQDAIHSEDSLLFHSGLSPLLNVGLLTSQFVVDEACSYAKKAKVSIESLEGFVRQILGWREYIRAGYQELGAKQRTRNFFKHRRKIPNAFWKGTTGIDPIDKTIEKLLETGYANHIERLMVFGNFMLLCEFDPDEVYTWFMSLFVDSYDWVMVPNVYGMSQFADGGLFMTKPYISSSNYILKMSNFKKGEWCDVWDGLFWRFLKKHRALFEKNPRMAVLTKQLDKKKSELQQKIEKAETFLKKL